MICSMFCFAVLGIVCTLIANSCNGKGPEATAAGLVWFGIAGLFTIAGVLCAAVFIGMQIGE